MDMVTRKKSVQKHETMNLFEECSTIIQKKIPMKRRDPGCFTITYIIGGQMFGRVLCDLGASINLMPLSIFNRLDIGTINPTTITLQMADRSVTISRGIMENILVKVDKLIFPADFVVLDMEEDKNIPLILGLILRVNEEKITFSISKAIKHHDTSVDDCIMVTTSEQEQQEATLQSFSLDPLDNCII